MINGKNIQTVQIWVNGNLENANFLNCKIISDNLNDVATFYFGLYNNETEILINDGNLSISGEDYIIWNEQADVNNAAYQYVANKLNLTIID